MTAGPAPAIEARLLAAPGVAGGGRLAVAVSGGGDSVALLHVLHGAGRVAAVVTVDHGLRPESAAEAAAVAETCAGLGLPHTILHWHGPRQTGNLMDQARRARAALIADWARAQGLATVALGHTADDQAETLLMNLARHAGIDGLAGLRPCWPALGVTWCRPALAVTRADLRAWLAARGIAWAEDPSNENPRFARARTRRALATLAPLGLTPAALAASARHLAEARAALVAATAAAAARVCRETAGMLEIDAPAWAALPAETARRLLLAALRWITGADHPPRAADTARLIAALHAGRDATLGGARFQCRGATIRALREPRAAMGPVPAGAIWDHRWQIAGPAPAGAEIRALGTAGLACCPDWRATGLPRAALLVSPALWQGDRLLAAPLARPDGDFRATIRPDFGMFILAH